MSRAVQRIPRESIVVATKTMSWTAPAVAHRFERFLRELDTAVLDIVHLLNITLTEWPKRFEGAVEALSRAKDQGKVRAGDVSCHGPGPIRAGAYPDAPYAQ